MAARPGVGVSAVTGRNGEAKEACAIIQALLRGCDRVLDLGCGERHHTKHLPNTVWVDLDPKHATDPRVLVMDMCEVPWALRRMRFDCALLTDSLEHLEHAAGEKLLEGLAGIAERIVIFTPLGELWLGENHAEAGSPHNHRSGWVPAELEKRGYETWEWPRFHRFAGGNEHGAFFAWWFSRVPNPTVDEIARAASVSIA